jgi:glutamate--cysteine ligase
MPLDKLRTLAAGKSPIKFRRGIEREALRVDPQGLLARTPHPAFLGSKLCHPSITTDFSEAQLELITPVNKSVEAALADLDEVTRFVSTGLEDEILWSASMPCVLHDDNEIPLAYYGESNLGRLKTTYRNGLGHRYGRSMQTICAVHYNYSLDDASWEAIAASENADASDRDYRSKRYFDLMRNFRRLSWLPVYLFGASPAVCNSFVKGHPEGLDRFDEGSLYAPGATSLRNGRLGYQSDTQSGLLDVCYNSLDNYVSTLAQAICTPHDDYRALGLVRGDEYLQVNDNVLQSEAEFYSTIRAKCVPPKGTNFLSELSKEGVEYLEVRLLDVDPYLPLGIDEVEIRFLDTLLFLCLLTDSPEHDEALCASVTANLQEVVWRGRDHSLLLDDQGSERSLQDWGLDTINRLHAVAKFLDEQEEGTPHQDSISVQEDKLKDSEATPSARVLNDMRTQSIPFFRFAMNQALHHRDYFNSAPLPRDRIEWFENLAQQSLEDQRAIEHSDSENFDDYLARINAEYRDLF